MYEIHNASEPQESPDVRVSWPFRHMRKGQFFIVPEVSRHDKCRVSATVYGARHLMRFTCKTNKKGELVVKRIE